MDNTKKEKRKHNLTKLDLDWNLYTAKEREAFVEEYLSQIVFKPTARQLEMIANYLLYGKDDQGKNVTDTGEVQIETKHKTWDKKLPDSLDGLKESPGFVEGELKPLSKATRFKTPKQIFSREQNQHIPELKALWRRIDETELTINYYDLMTGKRKFSPRDELLERFTKEERIEIKEKAEQLDPSTLYKLRHLLVELRREQYTIRDSYVNPVVNHVTRPQLNLDDHPITLGFDIPIFPMGLAYEVTAPLFEEITEKTKQHYDLIWMVEDHFYEVPELHLDLRNPDHLGELVLFKKDLEVQWEETDKKSESNLKALIDTLNFFTRIAKLTDIQREILEMKIDHIQNTEISDTINKKWSKTYSPNYISTIFRRKILVRIAEAVDLHWKTLLMIDDDENLKVCNTCGRLLLKDGMNFVKKSRSKDGFSNRCKVCDKKIREEKKKE